MRSRENLIHYLAAMHLGALLEAEQMSDPRPGDFAMSMVLDELESLGMHLPHPAVPAV